MIHPLKIYNDYDEPVDIFVSKYTGNGSDEWYSVAAGKTDIWKRKEGWEMIVFKDKHDSSIRVGVYVHVQKVSKVVFQGFHTDVDVQFNNST